MNIGYLILVNRSDIAIFLEGILPKLLTFQYKTIFVHVNKSHKNFCFNFFKKHLTEKQKLEIHFLNSNKTSWGVCLYKIKNKVYERDNK